MTISEKMTKERATATAAIAMLEPFKVRCSCGVDGGHMLDCDYWRHPIIENIFDEGSGTLSVRHDDGRPSSEVTVLRYYVETAK